MSDATVQTGATAAGPAMPRGAAADADPAGLDLFQYVRACIRFWYVLVGMPVVLAGAAFAWQKLGKPQYEAAIVLDPGVTAIQDLEMLAGASGPPSGAAPSVSRAENRVRIALTAGGIEEALAAQDSYLSALRVRATELRLNYLESSRAAAETELGKVREDVRKAVDSLAAMRASVPAPTSSQPDLLRARLRETFAQEAALLKSEIVELKKRLKPGDPILASKEERVADLQRAYTEVLGDSSLAAEKRMAEIEYQAGLLSGFLARERQLMDSRRNLATQIEMGAAPFSVVRRTDAPEALPPLGPRAPLYALVSGFALALVVLGVVAWYREQAQWRRGTGPSR